MIGGLMARAMAGTELTHWQAGDRYAVVMVKRADIIRFMGAKGATPICPSCGSNNWSITDGSEEMPHTLILAAMPNGTFTIPPQGFPAIVMLCNHCGLFRQHSLNMIDHWVKEGKGEAQGGVDQGSAKAPADD